MYLAVPLILGRREVMGDDIPDVLQSKTSSASFSFIVLVDALPQFLD